ncbi:hypothetical protein ES708_25940 [subsurface metagenome]
MGNSFNQIINLTPVLDGLVIVGADIEALNDVSLTEIPGGYFEMSDDLIHSNDDEVIHDHKVWTKVKEIWTPYNGTMRIKFDIRHGTGSSYVWGKIYKDGVEHGAQKENLTEIYETYSDDLVFAEGDLIQLYTYSECETVDCYARNLRIYGLINNSFINIAL